MSGRSSSGAIIFHPTSVYPVGHWALHCWSEADPEFIAHIEARGHLFAVFANPTDCRGLRVIVALADLNDMRSTLNRPYTVDEEEGLAVAASRVKWAFQTTFSVVAQLAILGNNAHHLDSAGALIAGSDSEPSVLHAHVVCRGDPAKIYAGDGPLLGPPLGTEFMFQGSKTPWTHSHLVSFVREACVCLAPVAAPRFVAPCSFYFVRHGLTDFNAEGRLQGHTESVLTPEGIRQAERLAIRLSHVAIDIAWVASSTLGRARDTTRIFCEQAVADKVVFLDGLREQRAGALEGRLRAEIDPRDYNILKSGSSKAPTVLGDAESFPVFLNRVRFTINRLLLDSGDKTGLVVSHGGVFRALLALTAQVPFEAGNCVLYRFDVDSAATGRWITTRVAGPDDPCL